MNNIIYIFIFACLITRFAISIFAKTININYLPFMSIFTSIISFGFLRGFIFNTPKIGFFGNKVWWQNYRIIHSFNFGLFSLFAFCKNPNSWIILFIDACLGFIFFINKYYLIKN
tara:strand:- start:4901 stop:5245 length:345 start_codon:yes stop_codon:yes gene_type:complete